MSESALGFNVTATRQNAGSGIDAPAPVAVSAVRRAALPLLRVHAAAGWFAADDTTTLGNFNAATRSHFAGCCARTIDGQQRRTPKVNTSRHLYMVSISSCRNSKSLRFELGTWNSDLGA